MKKIILFCLAMATAFPSVFAQNTVTVIVKNIKKATGNIEVGLYDSPKYWLGDDDQYFEESYDCTNTPTMTLVIPNVENGTYAFSLFHDENGNGKMDFRTWIPKEPYGFSNNPRAKWSKPSFSKCSFSVNNSDVTIEVNLQGW